MEWHSCIIAAVTGARNIGGPHPPASRSAAPTESEPIPGPIAREPDPPPRELPRLDRGSADNYAKYFAGMNQSMQQKIALTTAFLPSHGKIVDMGCGSATGTFDLANLHPSVQVVGLDGDPTTVAMISARYRRPNLRFEAGDVAKTAFPEGSVNGFLNSSLFHELRKRENRFTTRAISAALDLQVAALAGGGTVIIRDFVVPPEASKTVHLDVPAGDGDEEGPVESLSTAALFRRFAHDFRSSENLDGPVPYRTLESPRPGFERFELSLRDATEFILRKDYRYDWDKELEEQYLYWSQPEFEGELEARSLSVVLSAEIHNPWIAANRFDGKVFLSDLGGKPLSYPATNFVIVGEKVPLDRGVALGEAHAEAMRTPAFLELERWKSKTTGEVREVARRPNPTLDLVPWFEQEGRIFVVARAGFPRPIINAELGEANLLSVHSAGYATEPISAMAMAGEPAIESAKRILSERADLAPETIRATSDPLRYFPAPATIGERVDARLVEIAPQAIDREARQNYSAFASAGRIRALDASQVLRACHVGGMLDARLELNTYHLLLGRGRSLGPWIGAEITLGDQKFTRRLSASARSILAPRKHAADFERYGGEAPAFLEVRRGVFEEKNANGDVLHKAELEYVTPKSLSHNTVSLLPVIRSRGEIYVGIERRELPTVQAMTGRSTIAAAPAWHVPKDVEDLAGAQRFASEMLEAEFGARPKRIWPLGGSYAPSPGMTPEFVMPLAVEIEAQTARALDARSKLEWVKLDDLIDQRAKIEDAQLLTAAFRLAHALGRLEPEIRFRLMTPRARSET
jgi:methyltransferase family protein